MPLLNLSYSKQDDAQIWIQMKAGDLDAFNLVFNHHVDFLIRYGHSITTDQQLIDDCVQEVFSRIWQKKEQLKSTDNIRYYLIACFRKELLKMMKKVAKRESIFGGLFSGSVIEFDASLESNMIFNDIKREQIASLNACFKKLSSRQKEVVYLKYYNDLSIAEIGEVVELDTKAVYNTLSKAMIILRKHLKK
ncbi:sigma-70 family RNA polymerase sigma factor [Algoriphagus aquimarinus]|uniref:RNA polymerase sigma factor n=1 Tax=Algoriphagus aquimarinus TaxID=237018 RepID=UPI0030D7FEF7